MSSPVRLHMMSTGTMESSLGGMLEGEKGDLRYPVPVFVIEHPRGLVAVDAGLHPDLSTNPERLGPLDGPFRVQLPADGSGTVGPQLEVVGDHDLFCDGTVTCLLTDGHTAGHQSVRVRADNETFVICGDCCHLRGTLIDERLPHSAWTGNANSSRGAAWPEYRQTEPRSSSATTPNSGNASNEMVSPVA